MACWFPHHDGLPVLVRVIIHIEMPHGEGSALMAFKDLPVKMAQQPIYVF